MSVYPPYTTVKGAAALSDDGRYRYTLTRWWRPPEKVTYLTFVMLNPSTADAKQDDPTIRRCVGFARTLGFGGVMIVNLYAYRATKPADLWKADEPTGGQRNDDLLIELGYQARHGWRTLVAAWGVHAKADRVEQVLGFPGWDRLTALGVTKNGAPRHPLYLPATATPQPWPGGAG